MTCLSLPDKKPKTSVLMVALHFDPSYVGANRALHLQRLLDSMGIHSRRLCGRDGESVKSFSARAWKETLISDEPVIFVSCGPFNYLFPVVIAATLRGKKIVVDLRDPWSFNLVPRTWRGRLSRLRARFVEKLAYRFCDLFVVCTPGMEALYGELFKSRGKLRLVLNGYDFNPDEYALGIKKSGSDEERFVCMGKFFYYSVEKAKAILNLLEKRSVRTGKKIELVLIGDESGRLEELRPSLPGLERVRLVSVGRLDYKTTLAYAANSSGAAIIIRNEDFDFGTKIFDCIGLGLPILDSFDHSREFYKTFKEFCVPFDGEFSRRKPDARFHRDNQWGSCLAHFRP